MSTDAGTMDSAGILLVYDHECPVCDAYCRMVRIRESVGALRLVNARDASGIMSEITAKGLDIDEGMVLKFGNTLYYGADAIHVLSLMSSRSGVFNLLTYWIFRSKSLSAILYPLFRFSRNLLLKLRRKSREGGFGDFAAHGRTPQGSNPRRPELCHGRPGGNHPPACRQGLGILCSGRNTHQRPGAAQTHYCPGDSAGVDRRLDLPRSQRAHPGHRARRARPQAVPLSPLVPGSTRQVEIPPYPGIQRSTPGYPRSRGARSARPRPVAAPDSRHRGAASRPHADPGWQ